LTNILFYNAATGGAAVARATDNEYGETQEFNGGSFSAGWTHIADQQDLLFYNGATGAALTGRLDQGNFSAEDTYQEGFFATGWTHVTWMSYNLLFYKAETGEAAVVSRNGFNTVKSFGAGGFHTGWTHVVWSKAFGLFYNASNGAATVAEEFDNHQTGQGFSVFNDVRKVTGYGPGSLPTGWTSIVAFGDGKLLFYNKIDGSAAVGSVDQSGYQTLQSFPSDAFARGWTHIAPAGGSVLFYNATDRSGQVGLSAPAVTFPSDSFGAWTHLAAEDDGPVIG